MARFIRASYCQRRGQTSVASLRGAASLSKTPHHPPNITMNPLRPKRLSCDGLREAVDRRREAAGNAIYGFGLVANISTLLHACRRVRAVFGAPQGQEDFVISRPLVNQICKSQCCQFFTSDFTKHPRLGKMTIDEGGDALRVVG